MAHPQEDIGIILSDYTKAYESQIRSLNEELEHARSEAAILKNWIREDIDTRTSISQIQPPESTKQAFWDHQPEPELVKHIRILSQQLKQQLEESKEAISGKDRENRLLCDRIEVFRSSIMKQKQEIAQLRNENAALKTENAKEGKPAQNGECLDSASTTAAERRLQQRLKRSERQNKKLVEMLFQHQLDADKVQTRLQSLQDVLEQRPGDFNDIEKLIQAEKSATSKARDQAYKLTNEIIDLENARKLLITKVDGLTKSLEHREADGELLKTQLNTYKEQADSFFEMMTKKLFRDDFVQTMNDHYEIMKKENSMLAQATLQLQDKIQDLQTLQLNSEVTSKDQEAKILVLERKLAEAAYEPAKKVEALSQVMMGLDTENGLLKMKNGELADILRKPRPGQEELPEYKANELARVKFELHSTKKAMKQLEDDWHKLNDEHLLLFEENAKDFLLHQALHPQLDEAQSEIAMLKDKLAQCNPPKKEVEYRKEISVLKIQMTEIQDHWLGEVNNIEADMEIGELQNEVLREVAI